MYLIERYLRRLKSYVKNKACPEGSIAEAYIVQKCMHFISRYVASFDFNQIIFKIERKHTKSSHLLLTRKENKRKNIIIIWIATPLVFI